MNGLLLILLTLSGTENVEKKAISSFVSFFGCQTAEGRRSTDDPFDPFVMRFDGSMGGKKEISVVLIHWGNEELAGWYYFRKSKEMHELRGNFTRPNSFELREYTDGEYSGAFFGNFEGPEHINGLWIDERGKKKQSFSLDAVKPPLPESAWAGVRSFTSGRDRGRLIIGNAGPGGFDFAIAVVRNSQLSQVIGSAIGKEQEAFFEEPTYAGAVCRLRFELIGNAVKIEQLSNSSVCGFSQESPVDGTYER